MLARISGWSYRRRWLTLLLWVIAMVGFNAAAGAAGTAFQNSFSLPGTESNDAFAILAQSDPSRAGDSADLVFKVQQGVDQPAVQARMEQLFADVATVPTVTEVQDPYIAAEQGRRAQQISQDGTIAFARVQYSEQAGDVAVENVDKVKNLAAEAQTDLRAQDPSAQIEVGGFVVQATEQSQPGLVELIGLVAAMIILLITFGSVLAMGLPLVVALFGIGVGLAQLTLLTHVLNTPEFAPQLASMIGIGVGIDYALFIVTRYRHELHEGATPARANTVAMNTAGRAVLFAGITVVISMLGLLLMGFEFIQGVAVGAACVVLMTMLSSVTLLPALLGFAGTNIDKWHVPFFSKRESGGEGSWWYRWSRVVQKHAGFTAAASLVVLLVLAAPFLSMRLGVSDAGNNPESFGTRRAYDLLAEGFGPGFNGPFILTARINGAGDLQALGELSNTLATTPDVATVSPPIPNADQSVAVIYLNPQSSPQDEATDQLLDNIRHNVIPETMSGTGVAVKVGGLTAVMDDFSKQVAARLPIFFLVVIGLSFLLLTVVFRSVLVPLKAAIMNLLSIGAAYGVIVAIFQWGWGADLIGIGREGPIESWVPIMLFAILFGLSMDYEVFLLSRIREDYAAHGDNALAVANGLARTARVITAAAAIMITVFLAFAFGGDVRALKLFAIGLAVAVFVDATIVRMVLVPSTMELLGKANWWMPHWLDRILPKISIEHEPTDVDLTATEEREPAGVS
jgi:RND superfamily putative drug exporter